MTKEQRADSQHAMEESLYGISQAPFAADIECDLDGLVKQPRSVSAQSGHSVRGANVR